MHSMMKIQQVLFDQSDRDWSFLALKDILSLDVCKKLEWELTIINKIDEEIGFMFGFVEHPIEESIKIWDTFQSHFGGDNNTREKHFGVYIDSSYKYFYTQGNSKGKDRYQDIVTDEWKVGDTFTMIVDFETREIKLVYNDKDLNIIFTEIPDKLHPAVSIYDSVELRCTKYDFKS